MSWRERQARDVGFYILCRAGGLWAPGCGGDVRVWRLGRKGFFLSFSLSVFFAAARVFFRRSGFRFWEAAYLIWFFSLILRKGKKGGGGNPYLEAIVGVGGLVLVEQVGCNHPQPLHTIRGAVVFFFFLSLLSLSLSIFVRGVHVVQYVRTTAFLPTSRFFT